MTESDEPSKESPCTTEADVLRAVQGDFTATEAVLHAHYNLLLGYVTRLMPAQLTHLYDPIDIVQDVYFDAFRHIQKFDAASVRKIGPWLKTLARHRLAHALRRLEAQKRNRGRTVGENELGDEHESIAMLLQDLAVFRRTPSQSAIAKELLLAVQAAMETLPPDQAKAVQLRYMEGLSAEEAANRMNRTVGSLRVLCHRALESLRLQLRSRSAVFARTAE